MAPRIYINSTENPSIGMCVITLLNHYVSGIKMDLIKYNLQELVFFQVLYLLRNWDQKFTYFIFFCLNLYFGLSTVAP